MNELWSTCDSQTISSKNTSINSKKMPATILSYVDWSGVSKCLDIGGGRFDNVKHYLDKISVKYFNFDPYNQAENNNKLSITECSNGQSDVIMINNVLNVICCDESRLRVVMQAHNAASSNCVVYTLIYEGDRSGISRKTGSDQWQANLKTCEYIHMHKLYFNSVIKKGNCIISSNPKSLI